MHERRYGRRRRRSRRDEGCEQRDCRDHGDHQHGERSEGGGPDTRFLQLEMSQVLYGEAEAVTKRAFRELLLESAKERFRERFGDEIAGLAELAVDELMDDVLYSLDIESQIEQRNRERGDARQRLRDIFGYGAEPPAEEEGGGAGEADSGEDEEP